MAPEVLCKNNHSFESDYFALGVITYELMLRKVPFILNRGPTTEPENKSNSRYLQNRLR